MSLALPSNSNARGALLPRPPACDRANQAILRCLRSAADFQIRRAYEAKDRAMPAGAFLGSGEFPDTPHHVPSCNSERSEVAFVAQE